MACAPGTLLYNPKMLPVVDFSLGVLTDFLNMSSSIVGFIDELVKHKAHSRYGGTIASVLPGGPQKFSSVQIIIKMPVRQNKTYDKMNTIGQRWFFVY